MSFNFSFIFSYWQVFLAGLGITISLTALTFLFATIIAIILVLMKKSHSSFLNYIAHIYSTIFKAIPALVMIIWVYYALPIFVGVAFSPFLAALFALTLNLSPFIADSIISGINAIPKEQHESALLVGMSKFQSYRFIVFPQVMKNIAPDLLGWFITELKFTSLASVIGLNELLHLSNIIISNTFLPFEVYTTLAVIYLLVVLAIELIFRKITKIKYKVLI